MIRALAILLVLLPAMASAAGYDRPIPQAQSATAEFWFAVASLALLASLYAVHRLVMRR